MRTKRFIPTAAVAAVCALGAVTAAPSAARASTAEQTVSANWSGYVVTGAGATGSGSGSSQRFRSVAGSWVVPSASCAAGSGYSSFWVGLGGSGAGSSGSAGQALEQAGTEVDCGASGQASEFAWYELVPAAPVKIPLTVHPGDHISTRVTVQGTDVSIWLADSTTGQSYSRSLTMSSPDTSSAEWVAEAPSTCTGQASGCTPLPLADFGTVTFSSATATTTSGHTGSISDPAFSATALTLSPSSGGYGGYGDAALQVGGSSADGGAAPSSTSADGSSFDVAWQGASAGGGDPGYGYGGDPGGGYIVIVGD